MPPKLDRCVQKVMQTKYARSRWPDEDERRSKAFAICRTSTGLSENPNSGYLIDLDTIELSEAGDPKWIQLFPYDTYLHPRYGVLEMNQAKAQEMADHVNNRTRGIDLDIDYEHKEGPDGGRAAGWIVKAEAREDGLYGLVSWTKKAVSEIKEKVYRYFSPEFTDEWTDTKGVTHKNVLFGGALTNRPFLKNIAPINLSEHYAELDKFLSDNDPAYREDKKQLEEDEGRNGLDPKELRKLLSLSEDASDDDVKSKIAQLQEPQPDAAVVKLRETLGLEDDADESKLLSEVGTLIEFRNERASQEEHAKKFAEMFPEEAATMKRLAENEISKKLEEWVDGSLKLDDGTKVNRGIPAKLQEEIKSYRLSLHGETATKFDAIMERIITNGLVELSEDGSSETVEHKTDAEGFLEEVKKFRETGTKEAPITFREAVQAVSRTHPELAKAYRQSTRNRNAS